MTPIQDLQHDLNSPSITRKALTISTLDRFPGVIYLLSLSAGLFVRFFFFPPLPSSRKFSTCRPMGQRGSLLTGSVAKNKQKKNNKEKKTTLNKQTNKKKGLFSESLLRSVLRCADGKLLLGTCCSVTFTDWCGCSPTPQAGRKNPRPPNSRRLIFLFLPAPVSFCSPSHHTSLLSLFLSAATEALSHGNATNTVAVCRPRCSSHARTNPPNGQIQQRHASTDSLSIFCISEQFPAGRADAFCCLCK